MNVILKKGGMGMKNVKNFFIGWFLALVGLVLFLQKLTFSDPSNKGILGDIFGAVFGNSTPQSVSGVLFVVIAVALLVFVFYPNFITLATLIVSILLMAFTIVSSMNINIATMSGLEVGIIVTLLTVGIGLGSRATVCLLYEGKTS